MKTCAGVRSLLFAFLAIHTAFAGSNDQDLSRHVLTRAPHHKVTAVVESVTNAAGGVEIFTNRVTIVANGLQRRQGELWVDASPSLVKSNAAFYYVGAAFEARFPATLNSESLLVRMPDGERLEITVIGLAYFDWALQTNVLIGGIVEKPGAIIESNHVSYADCFDDVRADVIYHCERGALHQNINLREQLPPPEAWGLNSTSTFLVVLSEVHHSPKAQIRKKSFPTVTGDLADEDIRLGSMRLIPGEAFLKVNGKQMKGMRVAKQHSEIDGRKILFEKIPLINIRSQLQELPPVGGLSTNSSTAGATNSSTAKQKRFFAAGSLPAPERLVENTRKHQLALLPESKTSFVIDWDLVVNADQMNFDYGTYIIDGDVYIYDGYFSPDVVIKYTRGSSLQLDTFHWNGSGEEKAVMTSINDTSVGEGADEYQDWESPYDGEYGPALVVDASDLSLAQSKFDVYYASPGIIAEPCYVTVTALDKSADKNTAGDTASFRIQRSLTDSVLTVYYSTSGAAQAGTDYAALPGAVTFSAGQAATNIVVTPLQTHNIPFSRLNLVLSASGQYVLGTESDAQVFIRDSSLPAPPLLINMDLATDDSPEVGPAAIGQSASDYWNAMHSSYSQWAISNDLHNASYVQTSISCTLSNTPGSWGFSCPDPMQGNYVYRSSGPAFMVLSNVPAGFYDLYLYSQDGNYDLAVGAQGYGNRRTHDWPVRLPFIWEEGVQYAAFRGFEVHAGETVKVTLNAGVDGYSVLGGFQLINLPPPSITTQPSDLTVNQGENAGWNVTAKGALPLSYQWKRNGTIIQGATLSSLLIGNVQPSHAAGYSLTVSNVAGQVVSRTATLTVRTPPVIVAQPAGQAVAEGSLCTFTVGVTGTSPKQYQWQFQGTDITGATGSSFTMVSAQTFRAGEYRVKVSNAAGSALSSSALLQVLLAPTITMQPTNVVANTGQEARFDVAATGSPTLQYQWMHADTNLPGATSAALVLPNVQERDAGSYKVRTWNGAGQQISTNAILRLVSRPVIILQPQNLQIEAGATGSFSVVATSPLPMGYQWKRGGTRLSDRAGLSGSTSATLQITAATSQDVGIYTVEVTNADGTTISAPAALTVCSSAGTRWVDRVLSPKWVRFQEYNEVQNNQTGVSGHQPTPCSQDVEFVFDNPKVIVGYNLSVSLSGWDSRHLEWYQKRRELNFGVDNNGESCAGPPERMQIYASVDGGTGLMLVYDHTFAWMEWEIDLEQHVLRTRIQIPSQYFGSKGQACSKVFIRLINGCHAGLVISPIERVQEDTVSACDGPPMIVGQPSDQSVCLGGRVTLKASVQGSPPMRFRWMLNGNVIQGETSETLAIAAVSPFSYGKYAVEVMNRFGTITSRSASIAPAYGQTVSVTKLTDPEESCSDGVFEISRNCSDGDLVVFYSVTNYSRPDQGYETSITLPNGKSSVLISIPASLGDPGDEVILQLLAGNYTVGPDAVSMMTIQPLSPLIRSGFDLDELPPNDDHSGPLVSLGFPVRLDRFSFFESLYVNNNGNVTFTESLEEWTPDVLKSLDYLIAPFWADVDTKGVGKVKYGTGEVNGHKAFGITWQDVGYYRQQVDKTNLFQLLLIDRSDAEFGDFDIELNFQRIQWETGSASQGSSGFGGVSARVGFNLGSDFFEMYGSGKPGKLIDGGPNALVSGSHGSCRNGRYIYQVRKGRALLPPVEFSPPWTNVLPVTVSMAIPDRPTATIRYTVDGSLPTEFSQLYSSPVEVLTNTQIRARGFAPGHAPSSITSGTYGDAAPCPQGIIAWWPGDGNLADRTGRHNGLCMTPGEGVFAPKFDIGVVGQAFKFDSSSGAMIRTSETSIDSTSFTVEGWVNSSSPRGGCLFERHAPGSTNYAVTLGAVGGHEQSIEFTVMGSAKVSCNVPVGQWVHFAAVCAELDADRHAIQLYLNGLLASEIVATNLDTTPARACFVLGSRVDGTERFYGLVDEISVYSRSLFSAEIFYIFQSAKGKLAPPVHDGFLAHGLVFEPAASGGSVTAGDRASFGAFAEGENLTYYWKRDGLDVDSSQPGWDANRAPFLILEHCDATNAGNYSLTVSNQFGSTNLSGLDLFVAPSVLRILAQPQDQVVYAGDSVRFQVVAIGSGTLTYSWEHDRVPVPGGTTASLVIPAALESHGGGYKVIVESSGADPVESETATLYVNSVRPPAIWEHPKDQVVYAGQGASLVVSATGTAPLNYQWYRDGEVLYGATKQILTLVPTSAQIHLKVRVWNSAGEVESRNALVVVTNTGLSPFIVRSPNSQTNLVGETAVFEVVATGASPLIYQWSFKGSEIPGETDAFLRLEKIGLYDSGTYSVIVSNSSGIAQASAGLLVTTVDQPSISFMKQLRLPEVEGTFRITGKDLEKNSDATNYTYFVVEKVLRGTLYVDGDLYSSGDRIVEHSSALTWSAPAGAANATNPVFVVHVATDHARSSNSVPVFLQHHLRSQLYSWGWNEWGQLGNGWYSLEETAPFVMNQGLQWQRDYGFLIQDTVSHPYEPLPASSAYNWTNSIHMEQQPQEVMGISNAISIISDMRSADVVTSDGQLWQWGENWSSTVFGIARLTTHPKQDKAFALGELDIPSNVYFPGIISPAPLRYRAPRLCGQPEPFTGLKAICGGRLAGGWRIALKDDGTLWSWGGLDDPMYRQTGVQGRDPDADGDLVSTSFGRHLVTPMPIEIPCVSPATPDGRKVIEVRSGECGAVARCADGTIWWWGSVATPDWEYDKFVDREYHEKWKPTLLPSLGTNPPVRQMSANFNHYVFLKENGDVLELGYVPSLDNSGLVGLGLDIFTPFIHSPSPMEMQEAHTNAPQRVAGLPSNIVQVSAGWAFGAALTSEGKVWIWGHRTPYKPWLANEERIRPTLISTMADITNVVAFGNYGIMAIDNRGLLWGWGLNYRGCQLGPMGDIDWDGTSNFKAEAVRIPGIENATELHCTEHNVFVLGTREEGKPVGLKGVGLDQSARISWQPYPGAESYYVFRSTSRDDGYELLVITNSLEVIDNGPLVNGTTYYYRVAAKVNGSLTANSWEVAVRPQEPPGAVTQFLCTHGCRGAVLSWNPPGNIEISQPVEYRIERATNSSPPIFILIATQPTNVLSYLDEGFSEGASYRVTAWNYSGGTPSDPLQPTGAKVCAPAPYISPAWRAELRAEREQVTEGYDRVTLRWSGPAIENQSSWRFASHHFPDDYGTNLINELVTPTRALSGWLWDRMTSAHGVLLGSNNEPKPAALAQALNQIIESIHSGTNGCIYTTDLGLPTTPIIEALLAKETLTPAERVQLNRRLLDYSYLYTQFFLSGSVWGNGDGGVSANWLVQSYEIPPDGPDYLPNSLVQKFSPADQALFATASSSVRLGLVTSNLNYIMTQPSDGIRGSFYKESMLGNATLSDQTKALLNRTTAPATGQELVMLNRLLIQDLCPGLMTPGPNWGSNLSGFRLHYSLSPTGTEKTIRHYTRDLGLPKPVRQHDNEVVWEFSFGVAPYSVCWASVSALVSADEGEASLQVGPLSPAGKPWPFGLRAISGYQQVYLDWKDDPRYASFDVRYTTDPWDTPSLLLASNLKVNRFWHATTNNTQYRYRVTAYPYDSGEALVSEVVAASPSNDSRLGPNSGLIFSAEATPYSGSVLVEWTVPHLPGIDAEALGQTNWQFYLERATSDGHYDILTEMSYGLAFFDDEAANRQTYTYRVSAIDTNYNRYLAVASLKGGNPGQTNVTPSEDLAFTLLPLQPGDGYVKIAWPPIRATGFKVQHSSEGGPFSDIGQFFSSSARENATNCCYHLDAQNGIDHSYRVIAITPTGVEITSDVKTARPLGSLAPLPPRRINASQIKEGGQRSMHLSWPAVRGAASYQLFSRINGALDLVYQGAADQCVYNLPSAASSVLDEGSVRTYPLDFEVRTLNLAKLPSEPYAQRIIWEEDNVQEGAATNLCLRVGAWTSTNGSSLSVIGPTNLVLSVEFDFIRVARVVYYANGNPIGSVEGGSEFLWSRVPGGSNLVWATVEVAGLNPANISAKSLFRTTPSVVEVTIRPELSAYQTAVTDLQLPAPALPIVLSRAYSSRITNSTLSDLAVGWNASWTAPSVTLSAPLETGWKPASSEFLSTTYYSIGESQNHVLTVTTPDGQSAYFQVGIKQAPEMRHEMFEWLYDTVEMEVLPYDPNQGTLSGIYRADLQVENSEVWEEASISLSVPRGVLQYSTPTGISYYFKPDPGDPLRWRLSYIEDLNANRIDYLYSSNPPYRLERIQHSCGRFVFFEHRSQDLLVYTQDPRWGALPDLQYTIIDGYLRQVIRPVGRNDSSTLAVTDYEYGTTNVSASGYSAANARRLVTSYDVRGIRVLANQYTGDGDLLSQTDANGKVTNYSLDDQNKLQISKTVGTNTTSVTVNHDLSGAISDVTDGSSSLTNSYDPQGRLTTQTDASANSKIFHYDEQDRMTGETDQLGNSTRTEFNELGLPTLSVDANRNTNIYSYDKRGNTLAHLSPRGMRTSYEYYSPGKIASNSPTLLMRESIIDGSIPYQVMRDYRYTPAGDLEQTTEYCADKSTQGTVDSPITSWFAYYPNGDRLAEIKVRLLPSGQQEFICTEFRSDALGRVTNTVTKVSQTPCGTSAVNDWVNNSGIWTVLQSTTATYDLAGRIITSTDAYGHTTTSEYDVSGNLIETRYPDGTVSRTAYDGFGRQEWSQDRAYPSNQLTTASASRSVYDSAGRMVRSERWDKVTLKKEANMSAVLRSGAARPNAVVFLEGQGQQAQRRHFSRTVYDSLGQVQYSVSPKGAVTEFKYDAAGRRTNSITYLAYTASTTDPEAAINPGAGAQPVVTSFTYDPNGNQATVTDGLGQTTSYFYDEENRLVKTVFPAAAGESPGVRQTFYDGLGRRIREEDESGTATEYVYDFRGLLQAVKLAVDSASPTVTQFRYDTLGNLITQEDAEKRVTYFEYDALGRRVKRILPGGFVQGFGYDSVAWQNQTLARSFVTNFNGQVIVITNDCMGRIMSKALPARPEAGLAAAWVSYAYNARGQLVQVQHTGGVTRTVQQAYDSRGDLRVKSTPEGTLSYSYNNFGELVCISARTNYTGWSGTTSEFENLSVLNTNASSAVWNYQYDGQGRLSQVSSDSEVADATYAYSAVGSLATTTYRNGITSGYDYNPRNWLRRVRSTRGTALVANFDYDEAGTNAIAGVGGSSEWDSRRLSPTGQRRRVVEHLAESTRTVDYDYDALKRLVTETVRPSITGTPVGAASYQGTTPGTGYDRVGNRRSREVFGMPGLTTYAGHQFDERDRLNPGTEFGYDANGNTTNDNNGGTYLYDAEDRLIRFSKAGTTVEFAYDDSGNRVKKAVTRNDTTTVTRYLVEDRNPTGYAQVMEEIPDQSTVGLVGYWRFDEATGTTALDQSVNGYNGTLVNGPVRSSGRAGGAVTFDGVNDYIQVGAQPGLTVSAELTASAWIYLTGTGGSIINNEGQYALGVISGNLCWGVANEDPGWHWIGTGWAVPANQWVHVAIVYGNGGMRAYANGALIQTYSNASGPIVDALPVLNDFRIGGRQSGGHYFAGSIDEVRVYNRALTATEVRGLAGDSVQYVYGLDLISQKRNGTTRYYGYDGLGSVRYVADDAGLVVDAYTYDAFGILTERKARTSGGTWALFDISQPETPPPGTTPTVNNYRYTGEQWDQDLGMYYLRARYYKPDLGRFWTMDSFEGNSQDPLGLHKYLYAHNKPVDMTDPSGHESIISVNSSIAIGLRITAQVGIRVAAAYDRVEWLRDGVTILQKLAATGAVDPIALGMFASDFIPFKKTWDKLAIYGNKLWGAGTTLNRTFQSLIQSGGRTVRAAEQMGEIGAAFVARKMGMRPTGFMPRYHGIDDVYEFNGKFVILEAKGGTSMLAEGQMSQNWIREKIRELKAKGDPWGVKLEQAMGNDQLQGMVVTTKINANGVVQDPEFILKELRDIGQNSF